MIKTPSPSRRTRLKAAVAAAIARPYPRLRAGGIVPPARRSGQHGFAGFCGPGLETDAPCPLRVEVGADDGFGRARQAQAAAICGPLSLSRRSCSISATRCGETLRGHRRGAELRSVTSSLGPRRGRPKHLRQVRQRRLQSAPAPPPTILHREPERPSTLDHAASCGHSCGHSSRAFRVRSWSFATPASQPRMNNLHSFDT